MGSREGRWLEEDVGLHGEQGPSWDSAGGEGGGEEEVRSWGAWQVQPREGPSNVYFNATFDGIAWDF